MTIHLAILLFTFLVWLGNDEAPSPLKLHGIGGFLKKALKGVGKVAKKAAIPLAIGAATGGLGSLAGLGFKGALGKIGKAGLNMITGGDGFQLSDLGRIAQAGLPIMGGVAAYKASKQAGKDSARSRELAEESMKISGEEYERAKQAWGANQGMRDQYRQLSMNLGDATNPFTKAMTLAGGQPQYVGDAGMMPGQEKTGGGGIAKIAERVAAGQKIGMTGGMQLGPQISPEMHSLKAQIKQGTGSPFSKIAQFVKSQEGKSRKEWGMGSKSENFGLSPEEVMAKRQRSE